MEVHFVYAESFKLDGGACFGVVPKSMWSKMYPPDENNMLSCSLRNLLVKDDNKLILFDSGMGNKQDEKFRNNFYVTGSDNLVKSIRSKGFSPLQVTDVVFTHLHFDHCGGAFRKNEKGEIVPVFKNATYWCSKAQWNWAKDPNPREKASYLAENIEPLEKSGKLKLIDPACKFTKNISLKRIDGHTDGQMIPIIKFKGKTLVYMADFIPTSWHVALPYVASFDTRPLISMQEKNEFVKEAADNNYILMFQHDANTECCSVHHTEKGVRINETGTLDYLLKK